MIEIRRLFARQNLRCTAQRIALFDTLRSMTCHPTAEELHRAVNEREGPSLSLATVYNTLEALCRAGLAERLATPAGCCRYDANVGEHLHVRFDDTGEIIDVPADLSRKLYEQLPMNVVQEIEAALGVSIDRVRVQLHTQRCEQDDEQPGDASGDSTAAA